MSACTFLGHRQCPDEIKSVLYCQIESLIVDHGVTLFYVGNQGRFDTVARIVLREMVEKYPFVNYAVILAYLPKDTNYLEKTTLPEGIEEVPPRYAIAWRNDLMIIHSDYVIAYVTHSWGGAAKHAEKARKKIKQVILLK